MNKQHKVNMHTEIQIHTRYTVASAAPFSIRGLLLYLGITLMRPRQFNVERINHVTRCHQGVCGLLNK